MITGAHHQVVRSWSRISRCRRWTYTVCSLFLAIGWGCDGESSPVSHDGGTDTRDAAADAAPDVVEAPAAADLVDELDAGGEQLPDELGTMSCDPMGAQCAGKCGLDCAAGGFACMAAGAGGIGAACAARDDSMCARGLACVLPLNPHAWTCRAYCRVDLDCDSGETCNHFSASGACDRSDYGFCL